MRKTWKGILFQPVFTIRIGNFFTAPIFLRGVLLNIFILLPAVIYGNFINFYDEVDDAIITFFFYFGCSTTFLFGIYYGIFRYKKSSNLNQYFFIKNAFSVVLSSCVVFFFFFVSWSSYEAFWKFFPILLLVGMILSVVIFLVPFFLGSILSWRVQKILGLTNCLRER